LAENVKCETSTSALVPIDLTQMNNQITHDFSVRINIRSISMEIKPECNPTLLKICDEGVDEIMLSIDKVKEVYVAPGATNLRKSVDGLSILIQDSFELDPFSNSLFLAQRWCNKVAFAIYSGLLDYWETN
jgi:hypothetical protein